MTVCDKDALCDKLKIMGLLQSSSSYWDCLRYVPPSVTLCDILQIMGLLRNMFYILGLCDKEALCDKLMIMGLLHNNPHVTCDKLKITGLLRNKPHLLGLIVTDTSPIYWG